MGAVIIIRCEVYNNKLDKFIDKLSNWSIGIAKFYYGPKTTDVVSQVDLMGYAEPVGFYNDVHEYVVDVWWQSVTDVRLKQGKNDKGEWHSCRKEAVVNKLSGENSKSKTAYIMNDKLTKPRHWKW